MVLARVDERLERILEGSRRAGNWRLAIIAVRAYSLARARAGRVEPRNTVIDNARVFVA
jgi:hypothetical protein